MLVSASHLSRGTILPRVSGVRVPGGMVSRVVMNRRGSLMSGFCRTGRRGGTSTMQEQTECRKDYNDQPAVHE